MTTEEALKFINDSIRQALEKNFVGQVATVDSVRSQVESAFQQFVDSCFVVHHIDFHEHIDIKVVADEKDKTLLKVSMTPKTKTGAAILLEWHRRAALSSY